MAQFGLEWILFYLATKKAKLLIRLPVLSEGLGNEDKAPCPRALYCRCQQIRTGDLTIESPWSYPLSHNSSVSLGAIAAQANARSPSVICVLCDGVCSNRVSRTLRRL